MKIASIASMFMIVPYVLGLFYNIAMGEMYLPSNFGHGLTVKADIVPATLHSLGVLFAAAG